MSRARLTRWRSLAVGWRLPPSLIGLALLAAVGPLLPALVALPQLLVAAAYRAPVAVLASLLAALLVLVAADEPVDQLGATAPRRTAVARIMRITALSVVAVACLASGDPEHVPSTALTLVTLVGEGLLLFRLEPDLAWALPTLHLLAASTFGVTPNREIAGWAWLLRTDVSPGSLIASTAVACAGLALYAKTTST